jgi:hypothetical protein
MQEISQRGNEAVRKLKLRRGRPRRRRRAPRRAVRDRDLRPFQIPRSTATPPTRCPPTSATACRAARSTSRSSSNSCPRCSSTTSRSTAPSSRSAPSPATSTASRSSRSRSSPRGSGPARCSATKAATCTCRALPPARCRPRFTAQRLLEKPLSATQKSRASRPSLGFRASAPACRSFNLSSRRLAASTRVGDDDASRAASRPPIRLFERRAGPGGHARCHLDRSLSCRPGAERRGVRPRGASSGSTGSPLHGRRPRPPSGR